VDDELLDALSRVLGGGETRRGALAALVTSGAALFGLRAADPVGAKNKKKSKRKHKKHAQAAPPPATSSPPPPARSSASVCQGGQVACDGVCVRGACCKPDCEGNECGDDGCGGNCPCPRSVCEGGEVPCEGVCINNSCCIPDCTGKTCADDGCGVACGSCPSGKICSANDSCVCATGTPCGDTLCCAAGLTCAGEQKCCRTACPPGGCGTYRDTCDEQPLECGACTTGGLVCSNPNNGGLCVCPGSRTGDVHTEILACDGF
jgi:hypothetical protein